MLAVGDPVMVRLLASTVCADAPFQQWPGSFLGTLASVYGPDSPWIAHSQIEWFPLIMCSKHHFSRPLKHCLILHLHALFSNSCLNLSITYVIVLDFKFWTTITLVGCVGETNFKIKMQSLITDDILKYRNVGFVN